MELTVREVAALLGRSQRAVRSRIERGELPAFKRGRRWVIRRADVPLNQAQQRALSGPPVLVGIAPSVRAGFSSPQRTESPR